MPLWIVGFDSFIVYLSSKRSSVGRSLLLPPRSRRARGCSNPLWTTSPRAWRSARRHPLSPSPTAPVPIAVIPNNHHRSSGRNASQLRTATGIFSVSMRSTAQAKTHSSFPSRRSTIFSPTFHEEVLKSWAFKRTLKARWVSPRIAVHRVWSSRTRSMTAVSSLVACKPRYSLICTRLVLDRGMMTLKWCGSLVAGTPKPRVGRVEAVVPLPFALSDAVPRVACDLAMRLLFLDYLARA